MSDCFTSHLIRITLNRDLFIYIVHLDKICSCKVGHNSTDRLHSNKIKRFVLHTDFVKDYSVYYNITTNFLESFNNNFSNNCFLFKIDEKNIITNIVRPTVSKVKYYFRESN